eukprot:468731-Amorphochlora_amoeboformis.AAC.3
MNGNYDLPNPFFPRPEYITTAYSNPSFQSFAYNEKQMLYRVFSSPEFTPTKFEPRPPPVKPEGFARPSRRKRAYRPLNIPGPLQPSK